MRLQAQANIRVQASEVGFKLRRPILDRDEIFPGRFHRSQFIEESTQTSRFSPQIGKSAGLVLFRRYGNQCGLNAPTIRSTAPRYTRV